MLQREETASHYSLFCLLLNQDDDSETIIQTIRERSLSLNVPFRLCQASVIDWLLIDLIL